MDNTIFKKRKVAYKVDGEGFPLVLIHGFCEDHRIWEDLIAEIEGYQIIRVDLPGFGESEAVENISIEYFAEAVKKILDDLSIDQCLLIGHSMGGYTALAFAELFPQYLRGFGIFHSHPFEDSEEGKEKRQKSIDFIFTNGPIHYAKQLIPKLFPPSFITSKRFLVDSLVYNASQYASRGIIGGLISMRNRPDRTEVLRKSKVPVLFILGEKDNLIPFEKQVEQTYLPNISTVNIFPNIGHMGMVENPKATGQAVREFCEFCLE